MNLNSLKKGQTARIIKIRETEHMSSKDALRLADLGLINDQLLKVIKRAPLGDPLQIEIMGYQLCLRSNQAASIEVRLETGTQPC